MKHKAQESLKTIAQIVIDEIADGYIEPKTVHDFYYGEYCDLENSINCQLTVEEIDYLCLKLFGCKTNNKYCLDWSSEKREEIQKSIENKMMIKREMWVDE